MGGLDHVRWVGGGTGAGKSTVACRLAARFGVELYSTDAAMRTHAARLGAARTPLLDQFRRMDMDQRWVDREPAEMYRTFPWFHGEGFELIIEDLRGLSTEAIVIAEGFRLLPELVRPHLAELDYAIWLVPTPRLTRTSFADRAGSAAFWQHTSDPDRALSNLLARDAIFARTVAAEANAHALRTLTVDGTRSIDSTVASIAQQFGLS